MPSTLESLSVFDDVIPDFASPPKLMGSLASQRAKLAMGIDVAGFYGKYPRHTLSHVFKFTDTTLDSSGDLYAVNKFFYDHAGRHKRFWVPSYVEELSPAGNASGTSLDIKEVEYDATYLQATSEVTRLGNYIWLLDVDGTLEFRKVTSATSGSDPETLTVSSSFSKTFTQGEFICGFLYCVRFAADDLVIDYDERGISQCRLTFIEDYNVTSEADA